MAGRRSLVRALGVWVNGLRAGEWRIPARGDMELTYDEAWHASAEGRPLSLSLPFALDHAPLKGRAVENYFDNLLPDAEPIRRRLRERFRLTTRDTFDLLAAIGRDCIGAVQLLDADAAPPNIETIESKTLTETQVAALLRDTAADAALNTIANNEPFRLSLAGAQEKTALLRHKNRWHLPLNTTPTTHIFKLPLGEEIGRAHV